MIGRTARTLTAVSALVLGFGPAVVQAADANNTPYAKYVDCSSSQLRISCVERGEVMNFGQLRDIIAAAMYREEAERKRILLLPPDSDSRDRPTYTSTDGSTPIRPEDRPSSTYPEGSTTGSSSTGASTADSSMPARPESRPAAPLTEETPEGTVFFPPALIPPSLPVAARYERGIDDQNNASSRLVFTVKDETGESSSYSVNVSPEIGQYIEREIIRTAEPTTRTPGPVIRTPEPTTRTVEPVIRTSETLPMTAETEVAAATPLDMQEVVVAQEMIPVSTDSEVLVATQTPAPVFSPSQPAVAPLPSQTTVQAEMQTVPAPAPSRPTVTYVPPAQVTIMESSVENQPMIVSSYSVEQQPVAATSYVFRMQGTTETVTASPVLTLRLRSAQTNDQTTTTATITPRNANEGTVTIRPYVIMISRTETVHIVPQQVEAPVNVLATVGETSVGATPGENVRDQSYSGTNETSVSEPASPSPSNDDDGGDDDEGGDDDDDNGPE